MAAQFGDPAAVRGLGQALARAGRGLSAVTEYLSGQARVLVPASWYGHGADLFAADWAGRARQASELAAVCEHLGQVLTLLADDLEAASAQAASAQRLVPPVELGRGLDPGGQQREQQLLGRAQQAALQAQEVARARLARVAIPAIGRPMAVSRVGAWAEQLWRLPPPPVPWYESLWHGTEAGARDAGNFISDNAGQLAQMGTGTLEELGGGLLMLLGAGGEVGGLALDATGIGTVAGVPAGVISTAAIGTGLTAVAAGADSVGRGATQLNMSAAGGGGGEPGAGSIDQSQKTFNQKELRVAQRLADDGHDVVALPESRVPEVRTPDALVDGVPTEFKSLDPGATSVRVSRALQRADGQAADAVIDARGSGLTQGDAELGLSRYLGAHPGRMTYVRIIGDGYDIQWP